MTINSPRDAVGSVLCELGSEVADLVVVTADVGKATRAHLFGSKYPERYFNVGIAEQHMVSFAAGLASAGAIPVICAFSMFITRAWEQIRNTLGRMNLNVKIIGTHSGFSDHADGSSHQSLEDIALMRAIHNMSVVVPADVKDVLRSLPVVIKDVKGPVYFRVGRDYSPSITDNYDYEYRPGKVYILEEGDDIAIIAAGPVLYDALEASQKLKKLGVKSTVINMINVKPTDEAMIEKVARNCGRVITIEEHYVFGGIGATVAEILVQRYPVPMKIIGVTNYGRSAKTVRELLDHYGLNSDTLTKASLELLMNKSGTN
ncbi:MAG: transketolase C-terminal domain-containing protein [Sulfolobales archaeon]